LIWILEPFYWIRMMKNHIGGQEEFLDDWKRFFYKIPIEIAKPFALDISRGSTSWKLCRDRPLEYFDVSWSPLHIAINKGHLPFFKYINEKVREKNPRDYWGRVPLHLAVNNKNLEICKFIYI